VSLAAVAIVAFFAVVVLPRATLPMADGDAWWHIHAGEEILGTGRIPDSNTWTIAGEGFAWTSQDWASNVLMAVLFNAGPWGVAWLSLAFALAVVAGFGFLWAAIGRRSTAGWLSRILWLSAGLIAAGPIIGIRVQTIDLLMAAAVVWVLWTYLARPHVATAFLLVPIAAIWVNLHAGWVMLFLLGGAVVVGEGVGSPARCAVASLSTRAIATLSTALAVAAAALVLNPNGAAIYAYPFRTAAIGAHRDFLVEWSPPNPGSFEGQVAIATILLVVLPTVAVAWRRMRTTDLLWLVGLSLLTLTAVRFVLFLGPITAALAAVHLAPRIAETRTGMAIAPLIQRWARPPATRTVARVNAVLLTAVVVLGGVLALARAAPTSQAPAIALSVPADAAAWVERHRPDARIFNTYSWGGYLARRLPSARVYIDGRSDIYGNDLIQRYAAALTLAEDPGPLLDDAAIDVALIRPEAPLNRWLATAPGWTLAFTDAQSALWLRED
jgi:hypothetical protein